MRLFELFIDDEDVDEIFAISLVQDPAIESDFVYFDKEKVQFQSINKEERLVMGPILIPNKKILRVDAMGQPYEVFFKPETVKKLSQMYLQRKYQDSATLEHEEKVEDVTLVESWVAESNESDKSRLYGLSVPKGTWMGTFKIENDEIWDEYVKTGKVKGFSIEGLFSQKLAELSKFNEEQILDKNIVDLSEEEATIVLNKLRGVFELPQVAQTYPGEPASGSISKETLAEEGELDIYGYETTHFYICPGAVGTFQTILEQEIDDDVRDMVRAAAVIADMVFMIEKKVVENESATSLDVRRATKLVEMFYDVMETVKERLNLDLDVSYMDGHISVIKRYL